MLRFHEPLSDDVIRMAAPSILAQEVHTSYSARYSYITTSSILQQLRGEGFQPFMVWQTSVRQ